MKISYPTEVGLTKLEWFAGMILQGYLSRPVTNLSIDREMYCNWAFNMAQAMLEESEKRHASQTGEREKDKYGYPIADEDPHD